MWFWLARRQAIDSVATVIAKHPVCLSHKLRCCPVHDLPPLLVQCAALLRGGTDVHQLFNGFLHTVRCVMQPLDAHATSLP